MQNITILNRLLIEDKNKDHYVDYDNYTTMGVIKREKKKVVNALIRLPRHTR